MRVVDFSATAALSFSLFILAGCASDRESLMSATAIAPLTAPAPVRAGAGGYPVQSVANPAPVRNVANMRLALSANAGAARGNAAAPVNPSRAAGVLDAQDVRVMSFNLRCPVIFDGPNYWPFRKGITVETIRKFNPDVLGTQECVEGQAQYLRSQLSDYEFFGAGRNDGKTRGEMCALFFKKSKFEKIEAGHFWLSDRPEKPGSKSWGSAFPRMVTWAKLRRRGDGQVLCVFNTHFDVWGRRARVESAGLLRQRMAQIAGNAPAIVTGDFNDEPGSQTYRAMVAGRSGSSDLPLTDALRATRALGDEREEGTRHDFWGGHGGPRIDWIFTSGSIQVVSAQIDHNKSGIRFPSDHFPMEAVVRVSGPPMSAPAMARAK